MVERRRAHRREPIEVEIRDRVLEARPLPWMERNDVGNEIVQQYTTLFNSTLRAITGEKDGSQTVEVSMSLNDRISDPVKIVQMMYREQVEDNEWLYDLDYEELLELIYAGLDANRLESIRELVDPNFVTPTSNGGNDSSGTENQTQDTPKKLPTPDSSLEEFQEETSSNSPTVKS